jgi:single-stranded-DNA-specific exonuclease
VEPWIVLSNEWDIAPWIAKLAWMRGIDTPDELAWRLSPTMDGLSAPSLLPGVEAAVARIRLAIERKEHIIVYGDYDVDGVTSVSLMVRTLESLGASCSFFIPNRFNDGYGLHLDCIEELVQTRRPGLMISVDCGVRSCAEVDASRAMGVDWVITDHHALPATIPAASAVVHPHLDGYSIPELAGVGVAFKLAQALLGIPSAASASPSDRATLLGLLKLVAIGTVADMMKLKGENALLVRLGLDALAGRNSHGIAALITASRIDGRPKGQDISFGIAPRLNAVGRMGGAEDAVRLLLSRDKTEAASLMEVVERLNTERKSIQKDLASRLPPPDDDAFDFVMSHGAHKGVIGIVAGQRMRQYDIPTAVCTILDGKAHASLRAPEGYDLGSILASAKHCLLAGGGHAAAAGMTFDPDKAEALKAIFIAGAKSQRSLFTIEPAILVDGIGGLTIPEDGPLSMLEPFGNGFPPPIIVLDAELKAPVRVFGAGHWKLSVANEPSPITWFFGNDLGWMPQVGERITITATPQSSERWGRSWIAQELVHQ